MTFTSAMASWKTSWSMRASSARRTKRPRRLDASSGQCKPAGRFRWNRRWPSSARTSSCSFRVTTQKRVWPLTSRSGRQSLKPNNARVGTGAPRPSRRSEAQQRYSTMIAAAKARVSPGRLLINGEWMDGSRKFDTINPATGEVLTQIVEAAPDDVDRAVKAARHAFENRTGPWRKMSASERGRLLWRLADLVEQNIDELAELETLDNGKPIFRQPGIDKSAFTGSTAVGKEIMRSAADTLKRVTLELGGKSPNIVFADSDIDSAVKGAINGIFYGKGEVCNAGSRLFVESKVQDEFMEKLVGRAKKMQPADPLDPKTRMGAIVSQEQMQTVLGYIEVGKKEGAKLIAGGNRVSVDGSKGFFIEPTIFGGVSNEMVIAQEEIFGPVLATLSFDDVDQVIELANRNPYGLAAAVWTLDIKKAHTVSRQLRAGTVWINTYGLMDAALPFSGYKSSGFGRELGAHAVEHYTKVNTVWLNTA